MKIEMNKSKSREEVIAEREARKASKLAAKKKTKENKPTSSNAGIINEVEDENKKLLNKVCDEDEGKHKASVNIGERTSSKSESTSKSRDTEKIFGTESQSCSKGTAENGIQELEAQKTKSQLRAERRAKQELQRALKAEKSKTEARTEGPEQHKCKHKTVDSELKSAIEERAAIGDRDARTAVNKVKETHKVKIFSHLYRSLSSQQSQLSKISLNDIHPCILRLAVQYQNKRVIGSNARCVAFLSALQQMTSAYKTPPDKDFSRSFESALTITASYIDNHRPLSVSMTNALKHLKWCLTQFPNNISDSEAQNKLIDIIDVYIKEQIDMAGKAICIRAQQKISNGDVILTYGYSSLIERIFVDSCEHGKKFRVIVVDSGPLFEGRKLLQQLIRRSLPCSYILLSGISYIMREVTKVFLGAHALLTNGYVMSRAGSSHVALVANSCSVPVLVCCETYKFSERIQMDAFVCNELGEPENVMKKELWEWNDYLTPLSLMYDVTPSSLVTAVITELAILPCTSVPVVLRVKPTESTPL